ncbi:GNAT family N-acetyltransferase [Amycolatopsis nigrescens]|uniref:GNAT family N-acetyltransferase n=1 Tax=Amycolatopsis nigrescens TaxID=381445 RepID=UPI000371FE15|nr:GNAT family N-acetyltransferase [Amycolatopsis nigrescens]
MVEIYPLTESDRTDWEVLARSFNAFFKTKVSADSYAQTWRRLLDDAEIRGITARLDGKMVGIAHYLFHPSVWSTGRCYLADLFVDPEVRRQGVATAMIEWVARDAEEHGAARLYWNTLDTAAARALYDKIASFEGHIVYSYSGAAGDESFSGEAGEHGVA